MLTEVLVIKSVFAQIFCFHVAFSSSVKCPLKIAKIMAIWSQIYIDICSSFACVNWLESVQYWTNVKTVIKRLICFEIKLKGNILMPS